MSDCLFCKIVQGDIPCNKVYEDEQVLAFRDINPVAPVHILVIPKNHIPSMAEMQDEDVEIIGYLHKVIRDVAQEQGLEHGYRVVNNCGPDGGQEVNHLHFHVLGKRSFSWPPG